MLKTKRISLILSATLFLVLSTSCIGDLFSTEWSLPSDTIARVNRFVYKDMESYYLWTDMMPDLNYKKQSDPFAFFDSLLYKEDRWSLLTDDYEKLASVYKSTEKAYGYSLAFGKFSNVDAYFSVIEYVYPDTPASKANLKRGDLIVGIDGEDITTDNFLLLVESDQISLQLGVLSNGGIGLGDEIFLKSETLSLNPVLMKKTIELGDKRVGYLVYNHFYESYLDRLDEALLSLHQEQVTDLVLDLRYNPGGELTAARHLCSSLAPLDVVLGKEKLINKHWNEELQEYWEKEKVDDELFVNFKPDVPLRMGLSRIYVLTTGATASASELTITGLDPYMEVIVIGDNTAGKYTGSITIRPKVYKDKEWVVDELIDNWAMQLIVFRYSNSLGYTDFKDGITPDYFVEDQLLPAFQLGDPEEPLLGKALALITGEPVLAMKSKKPVEYTLLGRLYSVNQKYKEKLLDHYSGSIPFGIPDKE